MQPGVKYFCFIVLYYDTHVTIIKNFYLYLYRVEYFD